MSFKVRDEWEENMKLLSRNINDDLKQAKKDREVVEHLREYLKVMESEPAEHLIKLKDVYHNLRRILGDE